MAEPGRARRLLFLVPFAPRLDAHHGGGRAIAQFLSALGKRHELGVLYLRSTDEPEIDPSVGARCEWTEEVRRPAAADDWADRLERRARLLLCLLRGRPMWVTRWAVGHYARRVREVARDWKPDVVHLEYHVMGQYVSALRGCMAPRILTQYEPGFATAREAWVSEHGPARMVLGLDALAWRRFEADLLREVEVVVALTERDASALGPLAGGTPILRIPRGIIIPERAANPAGTLPHSLLFVGNFVHPPNVDAALRLVRDILPLVLARVPETVLRIVGDRPPPELNRLASRQVVVAGPVPDLGPYLDQAAVVIAPLRRGGGMRLKVMEALAAGKAVVASPLAAEGLAIRSGEELVVASTEREFAEAIVRLLGAASERVALATRARSWAVSNLGWDTAVGAYETLYDRLIPSTAYTS